jgi:TDG/mug DNA glycosylase family protein
MLDDLLAPGLAVVFCGSAAGTRSARLRQYYAGHGNKFWRILAETGLTPRRLDPSEYRQLLSHGIGLTDLVKHQSGGDAQIDFRRAGVRELERKIARLQPGVLCFNGKRAASEFLGRRAIEPGLQPEVIGATRIFAAPSTSGAANGSWDPAQWQRLAELIGKTQAAGRSSNRLGPRTRKESIRSRPSPPRSNRASAGTSASRATRASSRASAAPRQKCSPKPKPR